MSGVTAGLRAWITRVRLNHPAVLRLVVAQQRMLDRWAETKPGTPDRLRLWRELHSAGDALDALLISGPSLRCRICYWVRPFDNKTDRRRWRWQRSQCEKDYRLLIGAE